MELWELVLYSPPFYGAQKALIIAANEKKAMQYLWEHLEINNIPQPEGYFIKTHLVATMVQQTIPEVENFGTIELQ